MSSRKKPPWIRWWDVVILVMFFALVALAWTDLLEWMGIG